MPRHFVHNTEGQPYATHASVRGYAAPGHHESDNTIWVWNTNTTLVFLYSSSADVSLQS